MVSHAPVARLESLERHLQTRVHDALAATHYYCLQRVLVDVTDGDVRLRGYVPSYYVKQMAQTAVMNLPDVKKVSNQLVVD